MISSKPRRRVIGLGGMAVTTGLLAAACSSGPTYDDWASTTGAVGAINMEAVQDAFQSSTTAASFERKVNEIYEGDGIVLVRVSREGSQETLEGFEDLNKNGDIDVSGDDQLFSIVHEEGNNRIRGHGVNSYHNNSFGGGGFLFGYIIGSSLGGRGVYYQTSPTYARGTLTSQRTSYRSSSRYNTQLSRNSTYFNKQAGFSSSKYSGGTANVSSSRSSYMGTQKSTGSFKTSSTGIRNGWGKGGSTRSGGATGGGGGQIFVGQLRLKGCVGPNAG